MLVPRPISSPLVNELQGVGIPPNVIAVRGYLGAPIDILVQAQRILRAFQTPGLPQISDNHILTVRNASQVPPAAQPAPAPMNPPANAPWRIYLTAALDCWVEIEEWDACVVRVFPEVDSNRQEAHTVWLRERRRDGRPYDYRIVSVAMLRAPNGFVAGRLVEDYMAQGESSNVVWDEQQFGPTTGKPTGRSCF